MKGRENERERGRRERERDWVDIKFVLLCVM